MRKKIVNPARLRDAMANYAKNSGASDEYCRGVIVGVVSGLMATGFDFDDALDLARTAISDDESRRDLTPENFPESWETEI